MGCTFCPFWLLTCTIIWCQTQAVQHCKKYIYKHLVVLFAGCFPACFSNMCIAVSLGTQTRPSAKCDVVFGVDMHNHAQQACVRTHLLIHKLIILGHPLLFFTSLLAGLLPPLCAFCTTKTKTLIWLLWPKCTCYFNSAIGHAL